MGLRTFFDISMPYCLERQENGAYVVQNRESKPIGFNTALQYTYDDFPILTKIRIRKEDLKRICWDEDSTDLNKIYLYIDMHHPTKSKKNMEAYLDRLKVLFTRKAKPAPLDENKFQNYKSPFKK